MRFLPEPRFVLLTLPFSISCQPPYLVASFDAPQTMLSWSITRPGFCAARRVAWLGVRNADLPPSEDPIDSISRLMANADLADAVTLVTSRDITRYHLAHAEVEDIAAACLTTVGLSNGERVGQRCREPVPLPGTINMLVHVSRSMSEAAFIETISIASEARTAAVLDARIHRAGVAVTGTGTDCIVGAAPRGDGGVRFAGLHTAIGEAVGDAVYRAVREGAEVWERDFIAARAAAKSAAE
ncbi:adenosylcobinamide amidohydrolase [Hyphomicrobium sp. CS1GBMeth3]|uniref:adenosylcobinamide amidohydrolase n=1 Tax=Hyphomicrobium sp. CS1GBMeth3 TaxID=1892845 RepID=UPI0009316B96|nr:adenosylcobinamide amidohydrolase [Hyphomicrobium sp. CS1GBMeth3]